MKVEDVGKFYTTTGDDIWQLITYCEYPTATMVNIKTRERIGGARGSPILAPFVELAPVVREAMLKSCPKCGAMLEYDPKSGGAVCPNRGTARYNDQGRQGNYGGIVEPLVSKKEGYETNKENKFLDG